MYKKLLFFSLVFFFVFKTVSVSNQKSLGVDISPSSTPEVKGFSTETVPQPNDPFIFAALPAFDRGTKTQVKVSDARAEIIRQYLKKYDSPLEPLADLIVELSDQNNFDYRWFVAIAQQESGLCKHIPENSYNCWGWGIYPEPSNPSVLKVTRFDSYEEALRRIAPQFTKIFLKGNHMKDPMEVMKTYTPPSDGSWAHGVNTFFGNLD